MEHLMNDLKDASRQETMIQQQVIERGIRDEHVLAAMRAVPRDRFFPPGSRDDAFADRAAPIGHDQTISQPYMVALMTQRLHLNPTDKVLEIGTGSGYQTAILARLADEIFTIERVKPLLDTAWEKLMEMNIRNVHFRHGDGTLGWPEAANFDRILITAGAPKIPEELLLEQLREGGIAILPVGPVDEQMLVEVRRRSDRLESKNICPCRFVKLIGMGGWGGGGSAE
jgi:protein-L-isoaspartate(D-aspartate) O-methyltransferase